MADTTELLRIIENAELFEARTCVRCIHLKLCGDFVRCDLNKRVYRHLDTMATGYEALCERRAGKCKNYQEDEGDA